MSDDIDKQTLLRVALDDADVRATLAAAVTVEVIPSEDPFAGDATISRPVEQADYVAAVHEHIDKFDGLEQADVDEAAVAAVLPTTEETA